MTEDALALDFYDLHEDMVPMLIRASRWSCLDCPEPSGEPWESPTDHCPAADRHHRMTGHRVNGQVEVRYRAKPIFELMPKSVEENADV